MFKGRSKGSKGRGGYGTKVKKVPLKGLFADGIWHCNCDPRLPAQHFQTKNGGKNHGRWFYTCQKAQPKRCDFFQWDDEAKSREAAAVLNNSRTEPLPSPSPQTPKRPSPCGLATPQTSSPFRPTSPDVTTPYTPSKLSRDFTSSPAGPKSATQTTTIQGSDTEEEFFDWPASDEDEMFKAADQASSGHSMPPPETPKKVVKTDSFSTPGKRRFEEMDAGNGTAAASAWPTPSTGTEGGDLFTTPATNGAGRGLFANLASPAETPTPIRYKDIPPAQDSELASEILTILQNHNVSFPGNARDAIKSICNKHVLYTRGIMKGRDVSRAMVRTKDERIAELQVELEGLKAERETNRAVIRHLRRDMAVRKEGGR